MALPVFLILLSFLSVPLVLALQPIVAFFTSLSSSYSSVFCSSTSCFPVSSDSCVYSDSTRSFCSSSSSKSYSSPDISHHSPSFFLFSVPETSSSPCLSLFYLFSYILTRNIHNSYSFLIFLIIKWFVLM